MNVNTKNAKTTSFDRYHDRHGCDRTSRDRRYHLESISRMDVQDRSGCEFRNFDPTMQFDSHDVDANGDRCCVLIQRQHHNGNPQIATAMASGNRAEGNGQRPGDPRRSIRFFGRNEVSHRKGQALVEFAFVSIVMVMMFTTAFALGVMLLQGTMTSSAAISAGRILHHHPRLSPEAFALMRVIDTDPSRVYNVADPTASELEQLISADYRDEPSPTAEMIAFDKLSLPLYDERLLVLLPLDYEAARHAQPGFFMPELNRLLLPNYVYDDDRNVYRYPGAVVQKDGALTVLVPLTDSGPVHWFDTGECNEPNTSHHWIPPLRISKRSNICPPNGLVADGEFAVTITYPAQAARQVAFRRIPNSNLSERIEADDSAFTHLETLPDGYSFDFPTTMSDLVSSPTRGKYGLGELEIYDVVDDETIKLRPYRQVFESTSTFRLGQRFEAMYRLSGTDAADLSPLPPISPMEPTPSANNFLLTSRVYDDANLFTDSTSAAATIPLTGKWRVTASVQLSAATQIPATPPSTSPPTHWNLELHLYRNGVLDPNNGIMAISSFPYGLSGPFHLNGSAIALTDEEDTLEVRVWQNSGVDLDFTSFEGMNWISLESVFLRD